MVADYVSQDKVRLVYRHFTALGERSVRAAVAAEAAAQQGRFWPYHDRLFDLVAKGEPDPYSDERLRAVARDLNLDVNAFNAALDNPSTRQKVEAEVEQARRQGVQRTPTVVINGQRLVGAIPYSDLRLVLDQSMPTAR